MPSNTRPLRRSRDYQRSDNLRNNRFYHEKFGNSGCQILNCQTAITSLPTAAAAQVDVLHTPGGGFIEMYQTTAQTLQPLGNANGLVLDGDQVDNETAEFVPGGNAASNPLSFVVGTDSDFFFRAKFAITDASGSDQFLIGFRKQENYVVPASFLSGGSATYTDFFGLGFAAAKADPNPVSNVSSVASAANVVGANNFTWADNAVHTLEVRVVGRKAVTLINGVASGTLAFDGNGAAITAQTVLPAQVYSFTAGLRLIPFIFVRQDADLLNQVALQEIWVGHLVEDGKDPNNE